MAIVRIVRKRSQIAFGFLSVFNEIHLVISSFSIILNDSLEVNVTNNLNQSAFLVYEIDGLNLCLKR